MEKIIGNKPTSDQKLMATLHKKLLNQAQALILATGDEVLKAIQVDTIKLNKQKITGILMLSKNSITFVSSNEKWMNDYQKISQLSLKTMDKEKDKKSLHNQKLTIKFGFLNSESFHFTKTEDTQEFIEILELKKNNPNQEVLTTATHNFDHFLHADRLKDLRERNVKTTFFLMKRDDMDYSKNGKRLLQERHKGAALIVEGYFNEKKKVNDFIVVDKNVCVYEYDNTERKAKLVKNWPLMFFDGAEIDHFVIKTEVITNEGKLILNGSGKKFEEILANAQVPYKKKKRKVYQKAVGFRSGKRWKKVFASIAYALILFSVLIMIFGEDTPEQEPVKEINTLVSAENDEKSEEKSEEKTVPADDQKEQEAELAEKERLAEEARLAEEKEEARIAEEEKVEEEAREAEEARVAEEARKAEEFRVAEEARKAEEARVAEETRVAQEQQQAAANVFYDNCTAVRAAGADPIRAGDPGYSRDLDRDGDGIACE